MSTGVYSVNLTADVYGAANGTVVNFYIDAPGITFNGPPTNYTNKYYPVQTGNQNGNNSQYASVPTSDEKAVVRYGWFPDNKIPTGYVKIIAALNNTPSVTSSLFLKFDGTTNVSWTLIPQFPSSQMSDATPTPTPSTPLSPVITLLSFTIGAAIVLAVWRK